MISARRFQSVVTILYFHPRAAQYSSALCRFSLVVAQDISGSFTSKPVILQQRSARQLPELLQDEHLRTARVLGHRHRSCVRIDILLPALIKRVPTPNRGCVACSAPGAAIRNR